MIEAYAFLAMFVVQILAMSVFYPARFSEHFRSQWSKFPTERLQGLYPGVDLDLAARRFLTRYRALNTVIAVVGLMFFGWLFNYLKQQSWDEGPVGLLTFVYFMLQVSPILFIALMAFRYRGIARPLLLDARRKAPLERRTLFDFVSPTAVIATVLGYFLFVAWVIYAEVRIEQDPFSISEFATIGGVTAVYIVNAIVVFTELYGKRPNPLETPIDRSHRTGVSVKASVYSCLLCVVYLSLNSRSISRAWIAGRRSASAPSSSRVRCSRS